MCTSWIARSDGRRSASAPADVSEHVCMYWCGNVIHLLYLENTCEIGQKHGWPVHVQQYRIMYMSHVSRMRTRGAHASLCIYIRKYACIIPSEGKKVLVHFACIHMHDNTPVSYLGNVVQGQEVWVNFACMHMHDNTHVSYLENVGQGQEAWVDFLATNKYGGEVIGNASNELRMCVYMYVYMYVCIYTSMYVYICVCIHVCMYV